MSEIHSSAVSLEARLAGLKADVQALLAALSVLPEVPFSFQAVMAVAGVRPESPAVLTGLPEAVMGPDSQPPPLSMASQRRLERRIDALTAAGLLQPTGDGWVLPLEVRALTATLPGREEARTQLVEGYVVWMEQHQHDWSTMLAEQPVWSRAINIALELPLVEAFLYFAGWTAGSGGFYHRQGDHETRSRLLAQAASLLEGREPSLAGWIRYHYGSLLREQGNLAEGARELEQSVALADAEGLESEAAMARGELASTRMLQGELDEAIDLFHQKLEVLQRLNVPREFARTCGELAEVLVLKRAYEDAVALLEQKLQLVKAMGDTRAEALTLTTLGDVQAERGDLKGAISRYQQALPVLEASDRRNAAVARANLGIYQRDVGDLSGALESFRYALEVFQAYRLPQATEVARFIQALSGAPEH